MSGLSGKKIILGITGGIAAYKTTHLTRLFIKAGAHVKVIMTPASCAFVAPLPLATLSKNPVAIDMINKGDGAPIWNNHVELGLWADFMVIAPATANSMAKMANGICDNLLLATYLSAKCPVFFAPAMDLDMYKHRTTQKNIDSLISFGNILIPAESGELASGLVGEGRMAEPETIMAQMEDYIGKNLPLKGKRVLITAGPTYEAIDPVRFIGNHSSGQMGIEIADKAAALGATVTLVLGPTSIQPKSNNIHIISVVSARDMFDACVASFAEQDIVIGAAAVADYRPKKIADQKIKKTSDSEIMHLELEQNPDILAFLGAQKKQQFMVGFALETQNELENAKKKIKSKNLDLIVLNSMNDKGAGFAKSTNKVTFIDRSFNVVDMPLKSKMEVAQDILQEIISKINE